MLVRPTGRGLRAVSPRQPLPYGLTWSPDGRSLAYSSGGDIWRVDISSGRPVNLTNEKLKQDSQPAWSPDGHWIAFSRFEGCFRCTKLSLVSPDGSDRRDVDVGALQARRPVWSPDGSLLALSLSDALVIRPDGTRVVSYTGGGAYVTWSPNGRELAFADHALWVMSLATQAVRLVTRAVAALPAWSRAGGVIAGSGPRGQLVLVRPDGRLVARLAAEMRNDRPTWGTGGKVAFVHVGRCGIDIARANGTHVRRLTRVC
jgi:Tol biopolymer transport system component